MRLKIFKHKIEFLTPCYILKRAIFLLPFVLWSCVSDSYEPESSEDDEPVILGAHIKEMGITRAGDKLIKDKTLNLTFNSSNGYENGKAFFNYQGIGYTVRYDMSGFPLDLVWSYVATDVVNGDTYSFYLDNLSEEYTTSDPASLTTILLPEDNVYSISKFVEEEENSVSNPPANDLWWGSLDRVTRTKIENITLYHVMSRFCLRLSIDNSAVGDEKLPASASLTNLFRTPVSFDRLTGNLGLEDNPDPEPFVLVENETEWTMEEGENGIIYYTSPEFVIPPQEFMSNARPRLTVKLTNGQTFSGLLPLVMYLVGENGVLSLWNMSFLKGYKLTLNVRLSNEAASLQFMPSTVLEWWNVGKKNLTGSQASLTNEEDFLDLIKTYNSGDDSQFYKWGYQNSEGVWIFNIFRNFSISANEFKDKMHEKPGLPYGFNLNFASITISLGGDENVYLQNEDGAEKLKALLNEGIIPSQN